MPWQVSERDISTLPAVSARATGGYNRAQRPNPNSPMENFRGIPGGSYGAGDTQRASNDTRRPISMEMLRQAAKGMDEADHAKVTADVERQNSEGRMDTIGREHADSMNKQALSMSPWTMFTQALKLRQAGNLSTGAAQGWEAPGHYDTQRPSMAGLQTIGQQQRQRQVDAFMANNGGKY